MELVVALAALAVAAAALVTIGVALKIAVDRADQAAAARESAATMAGVKALAEERHRAAEDRADEWERHAEHERRRADVLEKELHGRDANPAMPDRERSARNGVLSEWRDAAAAVRPAAGRQRGAGPVAGVREVPAAGAVGDPP